MIVETVRVSQKAKDQLIKLKRVTGIQNWNVLCRWALCASLSDPMPPQHLPIKTDSSIEMDWRTFAGKEELVYDVLIRHVAHITGEDANQLFLMHLHRGIALLASIPDDSILNLINKGLT